ncbi:hypothetical protein C2E23DRAFT_866479 [Lenzites betulinus]|nr:hypothetical protein C2E23DRAFT_866479 [Lenzites betulinus]
MSQVQDGYQSFTGPWSWSDAVVAAPTTDDLWVITSPNMDFIPQPPIGIMNRKHNDTFNFTPSRDDFEILEGSIIKCLGLLRESVVKPLSDVVDELHRDIIASSTTDSRIGWLNIAMHHARDRLRRFPCTFRDVLMQVRETQRYALMARAFLDFHLLDVPAAGMHARKVNRGIMGAFTTQPAIVQRLYACGVPVWYVRTDISVLSDDRVGAVVTPTDPSHICLKHGKEQGAVLYRGLVGPKHLATMARGGHTYLDISRAPLLAVEEDGGYSAPVSQKDHKQHSRGDQSHGSAGVGPSASEGRTPYTDPKVNPSQVRGVNKFLPTEHEWMPQRLAAWNDAMAAVDLSAPAKPQSQMWGYWIPEPGLLLRPQTQDRLHRYVVNWVRIRLAWLYVLRLRESRVTRVPTQWWRDVLYGTTGQNAKDEKTRVAQRWREIEDVFGVAFDRWDFDPSPFGAPRWFNKSIDSYEANVWRPIIWEVCELGFRHELLALDRLLVPCRGTAQTEEHRELLLSDIFPDGGVYSVHALPTVHKDLGSRTRSLEGFRRVLARWPRCPPSIHSAPPFDTHLKHDDIVAREKELVAFYVNTFFDNSGRAPIVPHRFPIA